MTTSVDIVNRALSAVAARSTIANFDLEQSKEAKEARLLYGPTRDALLRAAPWDFCKRVEYLTLLKAAPGTPENTSTATTWDPATMPAPPWLYEYAYPSDCVFVRYVAPPPQTLTDALTPPIFSVAAYSPQVVPRIQPSRFMIGSGKDSLGNQTTIINTNVQTATCCYNVRVTVEDLWDPSFQEAMVQALAARFAMSLTGNLDVVKIAAAQARQAITEARTRDGNEGLTKIESVPDWLRVRGVLGDYASSGNYYTPWSDPSFLVM
jgi:hypothetical protein